MKDVSFGQYYPVKSFVHALDPRVKIIFLIAFITATFVAKEFLALGICGALLIFAILFSRIPLSKILRAVRGILFLVIFTATLNLLFYPGETVYFSWKFLQVTKEGILFSVFLVIRLVLLVLASSLLTYTTTPVALTDGIESLLTPLSWIHFPVHALTLVMSIALRFIPKLSEDTETIMNAQRARGARLDDGGLITRIKAFIPVMIALLISSFRLAEELGDAMDARCYGSAKKRTKYKKLTLRARDYFVLFLIAALIAGTVLLRIYPQFAI